MNLSESIVEDAAFEWFGEVGCAVGRGRALVALQRPKPEMASMHLGQMAEGGAYAAVRPEIIGVIRVPLPDEPNTFEAFNRLCAMPFEQPNPTTSNLAPSSPCATCCYQSC